MFFFSSSPTQIRDTYVAPALCQWNTSLGMSLLHTEEGRPAVYSAFHLTALIPYSLFLFPTKIDVPVGSERCLPAVQLVNLISIVSTSLPSCRHGHASKVFDQWL